MTDIVKVYGASWCPDCRRTKKFLADQRIHFEWHDIESDPDGVEVVQGRNDGNNVIPTVVFPDGSHLAEPSNEQLADKLGLSRSAMMHVYDLIVIGGGPAGLTAALYAARENQSVLIVDAGGLGGQAALTERFDNYPGFPEGIGGSELADRIVEQAKRFGVETLSAVSVRGVNSEGNQVDVETSTGDHYHAHAALIATGSGYRRTGVEGEEELMVVGGGNSGLEEGLFLTQFTDLVTIVEFADELGGSRFLQDKVNHHPNMRVLTGHAVRSFKEKGDSGKLGEVLVEERATGETTTMHPDGAFIFIGLDPNTGFVEGLVELDARKFIATDVGFQTSVPGLFAAGDVRAGSTKQLAAAVGEGAGAAIAIRRYLERQLDEAEQ